MRTIFFSLLFSLFSFAATAQTVATKTADGNFEQVEVKPTVESLTKGCEKSPAMFRDKDGKQHPVYLSKSGKMFYVATSKKTGNPYRRYFTVTE